MCEGLADFCVDDLHRRYLVTAIHTVNPILPRDSIPLLEEDSRHGHLAVSRHVYGEPFRNGI